MLWGTRLTRLHGLSFAGAPEVVASPPPAVHRPQACNRATALPHQASSTPASPQAEARALGEHTGSRTRCSSAVCRAERESAGRKRGGEPSICGSTAPFERELHARAHAWAGWLALVGCPVCSSGPLSLFLFFSIFAETCTRALCSNKI